MNQKKQGSILGTLLPLIAVAIACFFIFRAASATTETYTESNYTTFISQLAESKLSSVTLYQSEETPTGYVIYATEDGKFRFNTTDTSDVENALAYYSFTNYTVEAASDEMSVSTIILIIVAVVAGIFVLTLIFRMLMGGGAGGANAQMMNFGKSRAQMIKKTDRKFADVAGLAEEKEELQEIVDFLKKPAKFTELGARIPKGVLLVGPPGTGKTLMAKAIAGEAGVPFFSISGSDFVEMFVGVGASRVRDLFADAKKNSPCIVFIDEIDAVARRRGSGMGGGHDEREQTLNQLLVEMDGFGTNQGIIVLAATNRVDILDPAILRPGRFDRKVMVQKPDVKAREQILRVHANKKRVGSDVDLQRVAQTTAGFTGADLENLLNEAAIRAAKADRAFITQEDVDQSFVKVGIGTEKKSRLISDKEKQITAYHETGHAILFHLLPDVGPVHTISIIPTGAGAAGYTMPLPEKDQMFMTKSEMLQHIMVAMGGRIAEEIIFGDITTGASQDIKQATGIAHDMITKYGMSKKVGLVNCSDEDEVFIGRDYGRTHSYSDSLAKLIDDEERAIIDKCYKKAKKIILENKNILESCTKLLLEKEKIYQDEFEALWKPADKKKAVDEAKLEAGELAGDEMFEE